MTEGASPGATVSCSFGPGDLLGSRSRRIHAFRHRVDRRLHRKVSGNRDVFPWGQATATFGPVAAWADGRMGASEILTLSITPDASYTIRAQAARIWLSVTRRR